ncbi:MAG: DUF1905 domain-containing protein [Candidatus Riflebacteria bacterium]|nr:DUF1905 domain-containing protein [Candidatus Riflebacteria bacterium]
MPSSIFGKVRAPVKVTLNGYTCRSTIASMEGCLAVPLRRSNRRTSGARYPGAPTRRSAISHPGRRASARQAPEEELPVTSASLSRYWRKSGRSHRSSVPDSLATRNLSTSFRATAQSIVSMRSRRASRNQERVTT